mmetsp:Transcript_47512/g.109996  ORF Transcript_47512/g.109996 Transcript_47512/m.109996 type:complete len:374 (+) Transcript_47512:72-1193(+)
MAEAEYGRFFLADYQCAAPMWGAAVRNAQVREEEPRRPVPAPTAGPSGSDPADGAAGLGTSELRPPQAVEAAPQIRPPLRHAATSLGGPAGTIPASPVGVALGSQLRAANADGAANRADVAAGVAVASGAERAAGTPSTPIARPPAAKLPSVANGPVRPATGHDLAAEVPLPGSVPPAPEQGAGSRSLKEIDLQVQSSLDKFFADENAWQQVSREVSHSMKLRSSAKPPAPLLVGVKTSFRVQVPKPYPGVQYRQTKDLGDKYPRYAKHGSTVVGEVEEDKEWIRVRGSLYLPLRIGPVQILEPLAESGAEGNGSESGVVEQVGGVEDGSTAGGPKGTTCPSAGTRLWTCGGPDGSPIGIAIPSGTKTEATAS